VRPLAIVHPLALLIATEAGAQARVPRFSVELEGGTTWQSYNDVRIPNDESATRFSLSDLAGTGPWPSGRLYLAWEPGPRHGLQLLLAPLSLTETGVPNTAIRFAGASYAAGMPTRATYTFNAYRLTYRYRLHGGERMVAWVGLTANLRDAVIALEQGGTTSRKDDLGFVPLIYLAGAWQFAPAWRLSLDADAIAGGPGRAEDVAVKLGRDLGDRWRIQAGYRMVEGGADVAAVYTFAWFHSAVISIRRSW